MTAPIKDGMYKCPTVVQSLQDHTLLKDNISLAEWVVFFIFIPPIQHVQKEKYHLEVKVVLTWRDMYIKI